MYDRARALDLIESALESQPNCASCGAPTTITDEAGHILLECSAARDPHGLLDRIGAALLPHSRREVVDVSDGIAA